MATRLRSLKYTKVALVDRGANPLAHINLFKRDTMSEMPTVEGLQAELAEVTKAREAADAKVTELEAKVAELAKAAEPESKPEPIPAEVQKKLDAIQKEADDLRERLAKADEEKARTVALRKAADLKALGAVEDMGALLYDLRKADAKAADRFEALAKGWAEQLRQSRLFAEIGKAADIDEDSPAGRLDALAKRYAAEHKVTTEQGYAAVMATAEGAALYKATRSPGGK